jgi:FMN phosphatase YigB (HAD superfamily)
VIFDVGGVLVALDGVPSLARHLGVAASHEDLHQRWLACSSVQLHETGRLSIDEFATSVVAELGLSLSPEAFVLEFAAWLMGPLEGAFDLVTRIPDAYRVGVLSNMSAFHWRRIIAMGLPERFDFICVSYETGLLKPSTQAFQLALSRMALSPGEVLFLDDGAANVHAARTLGMAANLVRSPAQIELALREHGVL